MNHGKHSGKQAYLETLEGRLLMSGDNLLINGSFEDLGGQTFNHNGWGTFVSIPGWTASEVTEHGPIEILSGTKGGGIPAAEGNYKVELNSHFEHGASARNARIYQDVKTDEAITYELSFSYAPRLNNGTDTDDIQVWWGDELIDTVTPQETGSGWTSLTYEVTGKGDCACTRLEFRAVGKDDGKGGLIDDVSLVAKSLNIDSDSVKMVGGSGDPADWDGVFLQGKGFRDRRFDDPTNPPHVTFEDGTTNASGVTGVGVGAELADGLNFTQIDYSADRGKSELLQIHFNQKVNRAEVTLGSFYSSESGGNAETGFWRAFNAYGVEVASGDFVSDAGAFDGVNPGYFDVVIESDVHFEWVEFGASPYTLEPEKAPANSDFLIHKIKFADLDDCECFGENLVVNNSFESHPPLTINSSAGGKWDVFGAIDGWTADAPELNGPIEIQEDFAGGALFHTGLAFDGTKKLELDSHAFNGEASTNSHIYQDLATKTGQFYTLSFHYKPRVDDGSDTDNAEVWWDGELIDTITSSDASDWAEFSYTVHANTDLTRLEFRGSGAADGKGGLIDKVFVVESKNLVVNGSLEWFGDTRLDRSRTRTWDVFEVIPGWTADDPGVNGVIEIQRRIPVPQGVIHMELDSHDGSPVNAFAYQDIDTEAGQTYRLELSYLPRVNDGSDTDDVEIWFDGSLIATLTSADADIWTRFSYEVTASGDTSRLEFRGAGQSDGRGGYLDAITMVCSGDLCADDATDVCDDVIKANDDITTDPFRGTRGSDTILGDSGDNDIRGWRGNDSLEGGAGNDDIRGGKGEDYLRGEEGHDTLRGGQGDDIQWGGQGDDNVFGGQGNDILNGDEGSDVIRGARGDDTMNGGAGIDWLRAGTGVDSMTGGADEDYFVFGKNLLKLNADDITDDGINNLTTIEDFTQGEDKIVIQNGLIKNHDSAGATNTVSDFGLDDILAISVDTVDGVLITFESDAGTNQILIAGVTKADLTAADFIFGGQTSADHFRNGTGVYA